MNKLEFKPWERVICDIRLVPKMVLLMVFSTLLIVSKQLWDASIFYDALLAATQDAQIAQSHYESYLVTVAWQTALMIAMFVVLLLTAARVMLKQTRYLGAAINLMANKNLSVPFDMACKDEYGDLARELERTRSQLHDVMQLQVNASEETASLSEVLTISMSETQESAQEEFAEVDSLASAMSEMSATVLTIAENAKAASTLTSAAYEKAQSGHQYLQQSMTKMHDLSSDITSSSNVVNQVETRVDAISSVVGTIQGISEQTNLLALNAAIEAARAGEAGRGFAVVADEVRNLAQRTQTATVEIQDMIAQLQASASDAVAIMQKSVDEATDGVGLVTQAGEELDGIVNQVNQINDMNFQIASAAEQQSGVAEEMNGNLSNVRELVQASVVVVGELLETSQMMQNNVAELDKKIKLFEI
ncbi:methyl-accepting chemotaxis protein [Vibrio sp. SM6]|uniref:Methyl-accepting chemotaxis protein n=1 Tax=Vibrio agarilyticus TaxID=2726741 RepID=A0A7X8TPG2_9VIBR|nr:methyl-accepting chemotaxis protein [Vibrio agarilyticus]NLS12330.1 methyl-accepting chemotaxis protein [Vibrio agarilyticus]